MKTLQHLIGFVLKSISAIAAVGLLLSYISIYIDPAKVWIPAFFGLFFMPLVILNILSGLAWALLRRKMAWVNGIVLLPSLLYLPLFIQVSNNEDKANGGLTVFSYNVHMFGIIGRETKPVTLPEIADYIREKHPDIVCLQEISATDTTVINRHFKQYPYRYYCCTPRDGKGKYIFGSVTLSRHPITASGKFLFPETSNRCIYTDIIFQGDTLRIYNNHLQTTSVNLERTALRVKKEELRNDEIKLVSRQLRSGFIKRAQQVNQISEHIAQSPHPCIVCGDFNDTVVSYTYRKMKGRLNDCFTKKGRGMPSTFRGFWPAFRIDYIFSDPLFTVNGYEVEQVDYSDHYPVIVQLNLSNQHPAL